MESEFKGIRATSTLHPKKETLEHPHNKTTLHTKPQTVYIPKDRKRYSNPEYVTDALRFLLESGIVTATENLPPNWQNRLYEEIQNKKGNYLCKKTKGEEGSIINMLRIEKNNEFRMARIRQLVATVLRERLPHVYKSPPSTLSFPQIAEIVGYNTHGSSHYAHKLRSELVRNAISDLTQLLEN